MYPNLYYVFDDLFGIKIGFLRFINSFGFFVAIAFLVAAALLAKELRRKSKEGLFQPTERKLVVGGPATPGELIVNFLLGFLFGFKILALFLIGSTAVQDPQAYIFSKNGSLWLGLLTGGFFVWMKWRERRKQQLKSPEERTVRIWPHDRVGDITVIALIVGLLGAKLFDIFENWSDFLQHPSDYIFSGGGLTFYGGLICAALAIIYYARKNKFSIRHLADAIAPSLMIAYAIGRIGCQTAGDGDWGIYNSAYKVDSTNHVVLAQPTDFKDTVSSRASYFLQHYGSLDSIPHKSFEKPGFLGFLPNWMVAFHYPHNVNKTGVPIADCNDMYCNRLVIPVFPTPLYEILFCTVLFFILWAVRKKMRPYGALFCLYLILNGFERFLIEKIRVNNRMNFLGMHPTQAEVISFGLMIAGAAIWIFLLQKNRANLRKV
ncbi:prolipoprotein diacylglyceryl transferase [Flavisolibacter nicotianae]|uniref:prolipoprotein diacylglyceryl transferase n=1 Tax=Flavisolibacter nicotianae TaxID=2364882 RepID=UPI000EB44CF8|nr:prolipoprotein diacylglyceryl transferase family protein [Flavisolibacter nicotianae]